MEQLRYTLTVKGEDDAMAGLAADALMVRLQQVDQVLETERRKVDEAAMDIGTIVSVLAASGATVAISQGVADWLRARRGTTLIVERDPASQSIKTTVTGIDPDIAARIVETIKAS